LVRQPFSTSYFLLLANIGSGEPIFENGGEFCCTARFDGGFEGVMEEGFDEFEIVVGVLLQ
jgi:hypothetical protein